ncbi:uncharacterized protein N7496_003748 [Penicillium cataractarum]|uniref:DUF8035 domain-containing protein n=1 Tax=Penicillium cataractarum TaxID=2100454 RepID=A0A9W9SMS6_9EURO|nr:uncharacterized protein N7496_003748 [Penicillium cataractarum]KAJ5381320.1 hypothetical protein N7496_003748 [Penicillium cataractarum]
MSRRAPPREYYEEEEFEVERERDRYPRSRRREPEFDEDFDYRRRRSMPPVEDLERMHIRDRPPRDLVRESFAPPRDRGGPVARRGRDELDEPGPGPDQEEFRVRSSRRRGSQSHRAREVVEEEESELIIGERERRGGRRSRRPRDPEEEDMMIRHRERASEGDLRPMEKVYEDEREEVYFRPSSRPRRRASRREVEFEERIVDDREQERPRGPRHRGEPSFEEELVMQWKDRPTPREVEEEEEIRLRETRRRRRPSQPEPRYVREPPPREPPGAWPVEREVEEEEIRIRERRRSRPKRREVEDEEEIVLRREERDRERGRDSAESDEILIRKSKRRTPPREPSLSPEPNRAPPIHQDVITHHRHVDHGFDKARPPRAPSPEVTSTRSSFDEIDIRRSKKGNRGRKSEEEIVFKHRDKEESVSPTSGPSLDFTDPWKPDRLPSRRNRKSRSLDDDEDDDSDSSIAGSSHTPLRRDLTRDIELEAEIEEEIKIHKERSKHRSHIEKITKATADEWSVVHAPSKEDGVEMTGALEVVEVAPKGAVEEDLEIRARVEQQVVKQRRDERWTEITKDLVVRDAIERLGYEFEETRTYYYIFTFLEPDEIDHLVELSDEIRHARRRRIREMQRERAEKPPRPIYEGDRLPPRPRVVGKRHIREREWIIDERR